MLGERRLAFMNERRRKLFVRIVAGLLALLMLATVFTVLLFR